MYLVKFPDFRNFSNFPHFPHFPREIVQIFPLPAGNEKRGKCAALVPENYGVFQKKLFKLRG